MPSTISFQNLLNRNRKEDMKIEKIIIIICCCCSVNNGWSAFLLFTQSKLPPEFYTTKLSNLPLLYYDCVPFPFLPCVWVTVSYTSLTYLFTFFPLRLHFYPSLSIPIPPCSQTIRLASMNMLLIVCLRGERVLDISWWLNSNIMAVNVKREQSLLVPRSGSSVIAVKSFTYTSQYTK